MNKNALLSIHANLLTNWEHFFFFLFSISLKLTFIREPLLWQLIYAELYPVFFIDPWGV